MSEVQTVTTPTVNIPAEPRALAEWLVALAKSGVNIFITGTLYDKLRDVFEELGVKVEPVEHPEGDEYVLMKPAGVQVLIEYYRNGERIAMRRVQLSRLVEALRSLRERPKPEKPRYLRVVIPDDLLDALLADDSRGGGGGGA